MEEEITEMFKLLTQPEVRRRIEEKTHVILPKTMWAGKKKNMKVLEVLE